jgi:MATE family multidrug resistance protein
VEELARSYFYIRIWAAPATLSLNVFKGFFIGMQNAVSPMAVDVTVNLTNIAASIFFAFYAGLGFSGIAWGTLVAQYTGLALAIVLMAVQYRKYFHLIDLKQSVSPGNIKRFFMLNADLFVRSLCFLFIYAGLTSIAARYGDVDLAVSSIMMKLMLLYSYFIDGFAYAGEALSGRYIGAGDRTSLVRSIKVIFVWCMGIGIVSTIVYWAGGEWMFGLMATDPLVLAESERFLPWLLIMPLVSSVAFTWDGIFIGATATKAIRNSMLWAVVGFFASYYLLRGGIGVQSLWVGYMVHLVARTVYLSVVARREVLNHGNFS